MGSYSPYLDIDVDALAARAEQIYHEQYQSEFEKKYRGQYAVIDADSGKAYHGTTEEEARQNAHKHGPHGLLLLLGIGFDASLRLLTHYE